MKYSYCTGDVTAVGGSGREAAGLLNAASGIARVTDAYFSGVVKKGTSLTTLGNAVVTPAGQYKTETQLKAPTGAMGIYSNWSTNNWDFGTAQQLPKLKEYAEDAMGNQVEGAVFARQEVKVSAKAGTLTDVGYTFETEFTSGTLYYVLLKGRFDASVSKEKVKDPGDLDVVASGDLTGQGDIVLRGLTEDTRYTLYVTLDDGGLSEIINRTFITVPTAPTLTQEDSFGGYAVAFGTGTLYYLLRAGTSGENSDVVSAAVIRRAESPEAGNSGQVPASPGNIVLSGLNYGERYTLYAMVESSDGRRQSAFVSHTFVRPPLLSQKAGALTHNAQGYRITFSRTLHYLLREGARDSRVGWPALRDKTNPVGSNSGRSTTSPENVALSNLSPGTQYTLYAIVAFTSSKRSPVVSRTFITTPTLTQKVGALRDVSQAYTADFGSGTFHWVLKAGPHGSDPSVQDIKDGTDKVGENAGEVAHDATSKEITLSGLSPETEYTLYAVLEVGSKTTSIIHATFRTLPAKPTLTFGSATENGFTLTGAAPAAGFWRLFFVHTHSLEGLTFRVAMDRVRDVGDVTDSGDVTTFRVAPDGSSTVVVGSGGRGSPLMSNRKYYVRAYDYRVADQARSAPSDEMEVWTVPTAPAAVSGIDVAQTTDTQIVTQEYTLSSWRNLEIHWVVVETTETSPTDLDGAAIVGLANKTSGNPDTENIGADPWDAAKVVRKGSLSADGRIRLSDLPSDKEYVLFVVAQGTGSGGQSGVRRAVQTADGLGFSTPGKYLKDDDETTSRSIHLWGGSEIPSGVSRRFYYHTTPLENLHKDRSLQSDWAAPSDRDIRTFAVSGFVASGNFLYLGVAPLDPRDPDGLMVNTKYYVRFIDFKNDSGDPYAGMPSQTEAWTRPETVTIPAPSGAGLSATTATTTVSVATNTTLYWALLQMPPTNDIDVEDIENADVGSNISVVNPGIRVVNKGSLSSGDNQAINFHAGASPPLAANTEYRFYYAVKGTGPGSGSGLYAGPEEASFRTVSAAPAAYAFKASTATSFTLTGTAPASGYERLVFVHTSPLAGLTFSGSADAPTLGGSVSNRGSVFSFKVVSGTDITVGSGGRGSNRMPNTKYYVRAYDYRVSDHARSGLSNEVVVWTTPNAPAAVSGLDASQTAQTQVVTQAYTVGSRLKIHWVAVETAQTSPTGLDVAKIVGLSNQPAITGTTDIGTSPWNTAKVRSKGLLTGNGPITVTGLSANTEYVLFVVAEGLPASALGELGVRIAVQTGNGLSFRTAPAGAFAYTVSAATHNSFTLDNTAPAAGYDERRFFVHTSPLASVTFGTLVDEATGTPTLTGTGGVVTPLHTFTAGGRTSIKVGGSDGEGSALSGNTAYYVRAYDYRVADNVRSTPSGDTKVWTAPEAPAAVPGINASKTDELGTETQPYTRTDWMDLEIHWIAVETTQTSPTGLDGAEIVRLSGKHEAKDIGVSGSSGDPWRSVTVIKRGRLTRDLPIRVAGLSPNTEYVLFVVAKGIGSGGQAAFRHTVQTAPGLRFATRPLNPAYSVGSPVAETTIPLTKGAIIPDASATLTRRFVVNANDSLPNFFQDGSTMGASPHANFTVNTAGRIVIGNGKGAGSAAPTSGSNPPLLANTKYYIYVRDYNTGTNLTSKTYDATPRREGSWTSPAVLSITVPTLTVSTATTSSVDVADDTEVHWVLLRESPADYDDLTGNNIETTLKGNEIASGREVLNEGMLSPGAGQTIDLHDGATLTTGADYVFYYVVKGATSGQYSAIVGDDFTVPSSIGTPAYTQGTPTTTTIPLTSGSDFDGGADMRRFYVSETSLNGLVVTDAKTGTAQVDGAALSRSGVWTFTLDRTKITNVTIGDTSLDPKNVALTPGTRYYVRAIDYRSSDGAKSAVSDDLGGITVPAKPVVTLMRDGTFDFSIPEGRADRIYFILLEDARNSLVTKQNIKAGKTPSGTDAFQKGALDRTTDVFYLRATDIDATYTIYAVAEAEQDGEVSELSEIEYAQFDSPPNAPTLAHKPHSFPETVRVYEATFTGGTLYYLLRPGAEDSRVTSADVKSGGLDTRIDNSGYVFPRNSPEDIMLTALTPGTRYTLYAITESSGGNSSQATETFITTPTLAAKANALTHEAQTYTAGFGDGTLYYLLREGEVDTDFSQHAGNVRDGADVVRTPVGDDNRGRIGAGDSKDIPLTGLSLGTKYTLYAVLEDADGLRSGVATKTFTTFSVAPTLTQKPNALTDVAQTYTAAGFSSGTLHWVLQLGPHSTNPTLQDIKDGTDKVGANAGNLAHTDSPKEIALSGLMANEQYTLYAVVEASGGVRSQVASATFTTLPAAPTLSRKAGTLTHESQAYTVDFTGAKLLYLLGAGRSVTREDIVNDGVVFTPSTGSGTHTKEITFTSLNPGTKYMVYAMAEGDGGEQSGIAVAAFITTPTLVEADDYNSAKGYSLTDKTQVYVADFNSETLHWVLRRGPHTSNPTVQNIKDGTSVAGTGATNTGDLIHTSLPKDISLSGLSGNTEYTLYVVVDGGGGLTSLIAHTTFFHKAIDPHLHSG